MPQPELIEGLLRPDAYPHPTAAVRLIETHISWVLLAGGFAYKIKKPLDLGFLDFSSLDKRRFCCAEEVRLNRRLAPEIYLEVVPITGTPQSPRIGGTGEVLEWAVRMRAFPAEATLDRAVPAIAPAQVDAIADRIARFHRSVAVAPATGPHSTPEAVMHPVRENFSQLRELFPDLDATRERIEALAAWSESEGARLQAHFAGRLADGFVRECHGDLHLGNIAWVDDAPLVFDCIEFNPGLRHVDVVSEVAFLFMDLVSHGLRPLAWRFLNRWLEHSGDYEGLDALVFYLAYRAVVRAKVAAIRAGQGDAAQSAEAARYLDLAWTLSRPNVPSLILMHGYSGSGKTWLSQQMLEGLGAIRLRSDVERKRLFGLDALDDSRSLPGGGIYTPEAGRLTFEALGRLAGRLLDAGFITIVDATFLSRSTRQAFLALAEARQCPARIVSMPDDPALLRERIRQRQSRADDASEADIAVLESQLRHADPLDDAERAVSQFFGSADCPDAETLLARLRDG